MCNKKVAVLMSTYNGENYIKEQLDSVLNQTYKNIEIYIRDDKSKDNTVNIVKDYMKNKDNIFLIEGENLGYIDSFFELIKICDDADYYAYCDQDDIWLENKIERAVKKLEQHMEEKPVMYFSNLDFYDGDMNFLETAPKEKAYSFRNSLVECVTQGMTMVINKNARDQIKKSIPNHCLGHDWWTYMICSGFGEIIYDDEPLIKYRRHNKSVTVEGKNPLELFLFRIKKFLLSDSLKQIKAQYKDYEIYFYNELNEENKKLIKLFANKYNFFDALKKCCYPQKYRRKVFDDFSVRILFLFGKL